MVKGGGSFKEGETKACLKVYAEVLNLGASALHTQRTRGTVWRGFCLSRLSGEQYWLLVCRGQTPSAPYYS